MRTCKKCGETKSLTDYYTYRPLTCKRCIISVTIAYRKAYPERAKEIQQQADRRFYAQHRQDILLKAGLKYREIKAAGGINRKRKNELSRLWYAQNLDKIKISRQKPEALRHAKEYHQEYAANNRERLKAIKKRWKERHPDETRFYKKITERRRRTRMIGLVTARQWKQIVLFYGRACAMCRIFESETPLTVDHFIPISKGGTNHWDNVWPLCISCNSKKRDKVPERQYPPHVGVFKKTGTFD